MNLSIHSQLPQMHAIAPGFSLGAFTVGPVGLTHRSALRVHECAVFPAESDHCGLHGMGRASIQMEEDPSSESKLRAIIEKDVVVGQSIQMTATPFGNRE